MARLSPARSLGGGSPKPKAPTVHLPFTSSIYPINTAGILGSYNPERDYQVQSGSEGLNDLLEEIGTKKKVGQRNTDQKRREIDRSYQQTVGDQKRELGYDQADLGYKLGQLGINFGRSIEDLSTAKQRGDQDYERTLTNMQHEYGSRAEQQSQNAIQQGTDEAGTTAASSAVRGANQAYDKGNVDLGHARAEEDFTRREDRLNQDYQSDVAHADEGFGRQQTQEGINVARAGQGATTAQHNLTHSWLDTLNEYATKGSHATRTQEGYETAAGEAAAYEASKLHPGIHFPGSTQPGAATQGPHTAATGGGTLAPVKLGGGPRLGTGRRLAAPRY